MREEHFYFTSEEGTAVIHGMRWVPDGEVRGVVQLVHGMCEHIARYRDFAEYLAAERFLVVGHDHLGHGDSVTSKDGYGYFAREHGNRCLVRDIHKVYLLTKREYDGVPYVMMGHSMGSFLTRQYLCCYGNGLDGVILSGTGYYSESTLRVVLALCRLEAYLFGWNSRSRLFRWLTSGRYNQKFQPTRTDYDWLSADEAVVDGFLTDEKCRFAFTVNGYYNLFLTLYKIIQPEYLRRMPRQVPVLFVSGEEDPVGDFGRGVRKAENLFREVGMRDVSCRLYAGERHELLGGRKKDEVYRFLMSWLERI